MDFSLLFFFYGVHLIPCTVSFFLNGQKEPKSRASNAGGAAVYAGLLPETAG